MRAVQDMTDWELLDWLGHQQIQDSTLRRWAAVLPASESKAQAPFQRFEDQGYVNRDQRLGDIFYSLSAVGAARQTELSGSWRQRLLRSAYVRETWFDLLFDGDAQAMEITGRSHRYLGLRAQ